MTEQYVTFGGVRSYQREGNTLVLRGEHARLAITPLTERIIRVRLAPEGSFAPRRSWAVARPDQEFPGAPWALEASEESIQVRTGALVVSVARADAALCFSDADERVFCADAAGATWPADGGVACAKQIAEGEHFYGFGERTGRLDKLGETLVNWCTDQYRYSTTTDPLYIAIPTLLALRPGLAYGVFFNNTWRSSFDMGARQPDRWELRAEGGELDYYVVLGPTPERVLAGLGAILGTTPLPPRWALGYHQSRWGYRSDAQVRELVAEFRRRGLPCDAVHLDIDYMDGYRDFTWNRQQFPDPAGLTADLRRAGVRLVPIIDAGVKIDPDYAVYRAGLERDMFLRQADGQIFHGYVWPDDSVFADFLRPEVRAWWGEQQRSLAELGVGGIWNDMNEPTVFELPFSQGGGPPHTIDLDAPHGPADERTTHAEVHNLYGLAMARASYEGLRAASDERPFVLTRAAYAGIQRWSACWMGDNMSRWEHLELAIPQLLNMGLSGVPFVGVDIGGFYDNASPELFARWMQFGALMPFCRGHSCDGTAPHEPWVFGPRVEAICREYLGLRYRLLPYLYTLFWESAQSGAPVLRPLLYHFPNDPTTYQLHDQVLLGPWLLAAPVYQPGREQRQVYLPAGRWYDWWSGAALDGPLHLLADAPLERMPLYVRAGAILPSGPALAHTGEQALSPLTLDLYPGEGAWTLYEDDGHSFDYEHGRCCTSAYRLRCEGQQLLLSIGARVGTYTPPARRLVLRLHGAGPAAAQAHPNASYDAAHGLLTLERDDDGHAHELVFPLAVA